MITLTGCNRCENSVDPNRGEMYVCNGVCVLWHVEQLPVTQQTVVETLGQLIDAALTNNATTRKANRPCVLVLAEGASLFWLN